MNDSGNQHISGIGDCKVILQELVAAWPKPNENESADFRSRMRHRLSKEFNEVDFLNRIEGIRTWGEAKLASASDEVSIQFADLDGSLQKAIFVREHGHDWLLKSLKFQCPVCFGTGKNDGQICSMCGGLGWGVS